MFKYVTLQNPIRGVVTLQNEFVMKEAHNIRPPEGGSLCNVAGLFICHVTDRLGYAGNEWKITNRPLDAGLLPPREPGTSGDRGT